MVVKTGSKVYISIDLDQFVWRPSFFLVLLLKIVYFLIYEEPIPEHYSNQSSTVKEPSTKSIDNPQRKSHPLPLPGVV